MTLSRQLFAIITILLLVVLGRMFWISMDNTRDYLSGQMQTQTSNAVDSLGLSLQPALASKDIALMDTLVNAVFDHGYYKSLVLEDMRGNVLIKRVNPDPVKDVPEWFIRLLPLDAPSVGATLTSGWMQYGKLTLKAHPGQAYVNLWTSFKQLLMLAMWTFLAAIIAVVLLVRGILKPLSAIEAQAIAITQREFPINNLRPWTREFRNVVDAMNRMTEKVRDMLDALTERAEDLQRQSRVDKLTGLANREGFMPALAALLDQHGTSSSGLFMLIKFDDFKAFNDRVGYKVADQLLKNVAAILTEQTGKHPGGLAGRIGGVDFALTLSGLDETEGEALCADIAGQLAALQSRDRDACPMAVGGTMFGSNDKPGDILSRADTSLSIAREGGGVHLQSEEARSLGNIDWQRTIENVLTNRRISLLSQQLETTDGKPLYREVLARMLDDEGEPISPASFMPMAERLGRITEVDRLVMQKATDWLAGQPDIQFGINISSGSLHDAAFREWMTRTFSNNTTAPRILIEFTEHAALQDIESTAAFIEHAHHLGIRTVMERFGSALASFHSLRGLKLDYIKLDGSYVRGIAQDEQNRFFLHTLLDIAHGLDIRVIAEHVEEDPDLQCLAEIHVDAVQGYHIGKPEPLDSV